MEEVEELPDDLRDSELFHEQDSSLDDNDRATYIGELKTEKDKSFNPFKVTATLTQEEVSEGTTVNGLSD